MIVFGLNVSKVKNEGWWIRSPKWNSTARSAKEAKGDFMVALSQLRKKAA